MLRWTILGWSVACVMGVSAAASPPPDVQDPAAGAVRSGAGQERAGDATSAAGSEEGAAEAIRPVDDPELRGRIAGLIRNLGSPDYTKREEASDGLKRIGAAAFAPLRDAYRAGDDLEVRLRIETIVSAAYLDEHLSARNGFLGIQIGDILTTATDPRIPPGAVGVLITAVVGGSAADRAGLFHGDVVIALDDEPIQAGMTWFRDAIRARRRGDVLTVSVLRRERRYDFDVILDGRPVEQFTADLAPLRTTVERRFRAWWTHEFVGIPAEPADPADPAGPDEPVSRASIRNADDARRDGRR